MKTSPYTLYNITSDNNCRRILHIPNISPQISRHLKYLNITQAHYSLNSIRSNILNNKIEELDIQERSGV
jgi:hypothetical protein